MTSKYCRKNTIIKFSLYRHFGLNLTIEGLCHCFAVEFAFARKATYSRLIVGFNSYDHFVNDTYCNIICYDYFSFLLIQFAYDVFFIEFNLLNCQKINDKNQWVRWLKSVIKFEFNEICVNKNLQTMVLKEI
mgnify:CR=1 FL=1